MLAKLIDNIPDTPGLLFEPKWDGFRSIVFRGTDDLFIQSRDLKPLDRYFPELHDALLERLPPGCVLDGEIVIATKEGLDFDALQLRLHPAASRVAKLAAACPSSFVAFDLLAIDGESILTLPQRERRDRLEGLLKKAAPPLYLTPMTRDRKTAAEWLQRFEGAGLDGVIAKPEDAAYQPGKRAMFKIKHARTADCVVAGFRWHKNGEGIIGSLLLGLFDDKGALHHVGVTSSFTMAKRKELVEELEPLRKNALDTHPWKAWAEGYAAAWWPTDAGRPEPLECRQGSVVGAAAHRARMRSEVRPHAGRSLPACGDVSALARRQAAGRLPLRSARGHSGFRAFRGLRCHSSGLALAQGFGIGGSFGAFGRSFLGHMLQVDTNTCPRRRSAAHRIDQHISGLE